ncbi:cation:proton antiporter domain-containing protein [Shewanella subflava]|uniref:Cation:proton antiporter n=1 Tax=Shewanella subflava TaxID=2986476 RepID=A0ABT3IAM7_9GAMM|nr:cation:proton antiporter [Shewanella subflava]MCW3172928.1 cation:proton antiporter [Shewanella subflava]
MDITSHLFPAIKALSIITLCIIFFSRLGVGTIVGFIVAGIVLGPNTPGPIAATNIDALQSIADFGVVLFLFTLGLEMKPQQLWQMKKTIVIQGIGQVLVTSVIFSIIGTLLGITWQVGFIIGAIFSQSSTAVVMTLLQEKRQLNAPHGKNIFSNLMAQDMSVVPIMALIPILAHQQSTSGQSVIYNILLVLGFLLAIFLMARYVLPLLLKVCAFNDNKEGFSLSLFVVILFTVWLSVNAGVSETLGAFLLGMLLSTSDFRLMLEEVVSPLKKLLMGLFFLSVGMSIKPDVLLDDFGIILLWLSAVLLVKTLVFILLALIDGKEMPVAIKSGFALNQVGEFAFVLLGVATSAGMLDAHSSAVGLIIVSISMIMTPMMNRIGDVVASKYLSTIVGDKVDIAVPELVIVGLDEVGRLIAMLAERAGIKYVAFDNDYECVKRGIALGLNAHYGDILNRGIQEKAKLAEAQAAFISITSSALLKKIALKLKKYKQLDIYARTNSRIDELFLKQNGVKYAGSVYVESTLQRGRELLINFGIPEQDCMALINSVKQEINPQPMNIKS